MKGKRMGITEILRRILVQTQKSSLLIDVSLYFLDKAVLTKFISGCRMVWDLICGASWFYKSKTEKVTGGRKSAILPNCCCLLFMTVLSDPPWPNIRLSKTTLCHKNHLNLSLIYFHLRITLLKFLTKFGLSEKPTKFEKICLMVLTNQLIYLVNGKTIRQIFSNYVCFSKSPNFNSSFQTFHLPKLCPIFVNLAWFKKYNNFLE